MTTGYVDASSNFHELGYKNDHTPNLEGIQVGTWDDDENPETAEVAKTPILNAQMTILISIDYGYSGALGAWSGSDGSKIWTPAGGGAAIAEDDIITGLNAKTTLANWKVGVKANGAVRFYATVAATGDPDKNGMTVLETNYGQTSLPTAAPAFSKSNAAAAGFTVTANYYVWGGDASTSGSAARDDGESTFDAGTFDVFVTYQA